MDHQPSPAPLDQPLDPPQRSIRVTLRTLALAKRRPVGWDLPWAVSRIHAVASWRRRDGSAGGGGADSGAVGDDGNATRRPSGGRAAGWRSARHGLVAKLPAAAVDVILQLGADRLVHGRRLVLVERLGADRAGAGGGVLAALLQPALVVGGRGQQRPVEAFPEPLHGVRGAQEVTPVPDLGVRAEG